MLPSEFLRLLYPTLAHNEILLAGDIHSYRTRLTESTLHEVDNLVDLTNQFFTVCSRISDLPIGAAGTAEQLVRCPGFWVDIDFTGSKSERFVGKLPTLDDLPQILSNVPDPSIMVHSGHGVHAYWIFREPQPATPTLTQQAADFEACIVEHAQSLGYSMDFVAKNLARVLRLPRTLNGKSNPPVPSFVLSPPPDPTTNLRRFKLTELHYRPSTHVTPLRPQLSVVPSSPIASPSAAETLEPGEIIPLENQSTDAIIDWLKTHPHPNSGFRSQARKLAVGQSFADNERMNSLHRLASAVGYLAPDRDPQELAQDIFATSLEHWDDLDVGTQYNQQTRLDAAASSIRRAQESRVQLAIAERVQVAQTLVSGDIYTHADVEDFASSQQCSLEEFKRRWIIRYKQECWIYQRNGYGTGFAITQWDAQAKDLDPAALGNHLRLRSVDRAGNVNLTPTSKLMDQYCTAVHDVQYSYLTKFSYVDNSDPQRRIMHVATAPIRSDLVPTFDARVDQWLRLLGGTKQELLLDWIAGVTYQDRACAALYLEGAPGTGKSFLPTALSRIWTKDAGPGLLSEVAGQFNECLQRCPLVMAEEQLDLPTKSASAFLREIISQKVHRLNRKNMPKVSLHGYLRLIMSANDSLLKDLESFLSEDVKNAIAQRFLYIHVKPDAVVYLTGLKKAGTWFEPDTVAQHALWLRDNRTFEVSERFLVAGDAREMIAKIDRAQVENWQVLSWLCDYLCQNNSPAKLAAGTYSKHIKLRANFGTLEITAGGVQALQTAKVANTHDHLTPNKLGKVCTSLWGKPRSSSGQTLYTVDADQLLAWCDENNYMPREDLEKVLTDLGLTFSV